MLLMLLLLLRQGADMLPYTSGAAEAAKLCEQVTQLLRHLCGADHMLK